MKRWYRRLSHHARWCVAFGVLCPAVLVVAVRTDNTWRGWALTITVAFCCSLLADVIASHDSGPS